MTARLFLWTALILFAFGQTASAQQFTFNPEPKDQKNGNNGENSGIYEYSSKYRKTPKVVQGDKILPEAQFMMNFVRTEDAGPGDVTLRLSSPVSINGCVRITPPQVERRDNGPMIWFTVKEPEVSVDKGVQRAHYECNQDMNTAAADIKMSRDQLMTDGVKTIVFQTSARTDYYNVTIDENEISLAPRSATAFKPRKIPGKTDGLRYHFLPVNTVILYVPSAPAGSDLHNQILAAASRKNLQEMANVSADAPNTFYFTDETGAVAETLPAGESVYFNSIAMKDDMRVPPGGAEPVQKIDIFARKPGQLD